jgi:hypothetical protein
MATNGVDTVSDLKGAQSPPEARSARPAAGPKTGLETPAAPRRRGRKEAAESARVERFFLAEPNASGDLPRLGREMANEGEAVVEAFRAGVSFFAISEFRTRAETSPSRDPILKKEAVKNSNHPS